MYSCYCEQCWEMDGWMSPVGDMCLVQAQCSHSHTFPVSNINGNNSVTNKQTLFCSFFWHYNCQCLVGFLFSIVLETASLGNWESQTADELSPHELSPWFHTLTNSHVWRLTHTLPLKHSRLAACTHPQL